MHSDSAAKKNECNRPNLCGIKPAAASTNQSFITGNPSMQFDFKAHARYSLERARWLTNELLQAFETREHWLYQAHDEANHAMWIVGHLALANNMIA